VARGAACADVIDHVRYCASLPYIRAHQRHAVKARVMARIAVGGGPHPGALPQLPGRH
jgi:hypothetical protein